MIHREPARLAAGTEATADVVDAVRWHDQKDEELKALKTQDASNQNAAWLDALIENFIAFDPTPNDSADKAAEILTELDKELSTLQDANHGPEAADYIQRLKRELELVVDKLHAPDATPQTKTQQELKKEEEPEEN